MQKCYQHFSFDDQGEYIPIQGAVFRQFLDICWPFADYITLIGPVRISSYEEWIANNPHAYRKPNPNDFVSRENPLNAALQPWLVGSIIIDEWFGYGPGSTEERRYLYHAADSAKEAILSCYQDILLRLPTPENDTHGCAFFDDLCLFAHGRLFFGSISHEGECYFWPDGREAFKPILATGHWEPFGYWRDSAQIDVVHKYPWK